MLNRHGVYLQMENHGVHKLFEVFSTRWGILLHGFIRCLIWDSSLRFDNCAAVFIKRTLVLLIQAAAWLSTGWEESQIPKQRANLNKVAVLILLVIIFIKSYILCLLLYFAFLVRVGKVKARWPSKKEMYFSIYCIG